MSKVVYQLKKLIDLVYTLNAPDFQVFFRFWTNLIYLSVDVHIGGLKEAILQIYICRNSYCSVSVIKEAIIKLEDIHKTYQQQED